MDIFNTTIYANTGSHRVSQQQHTTRQRQHVRACTSAVVNTPKKTWRRWNHLCCCDCRVNSELHHQHSTPWLQQPLQQQQPVPSLPSLAAGRRRLSSRMHLLWYALTLVQFPPTCPQTQITSDHSLFTLTHTHNTVAGGSADRVPVFRRLAARRVCGACGRWHQPGRHQGRLQAAACAVPRLAG